MVRLGITSEEFYNMSPRELYYAMIEYSELQMERIKIESSLMRLQTVMVLNPFIKPKIKDPRKLIQFAWEEDMKQTPESMKAILMQLGANTGLKTKLKTNKTK